jgi:hypothetical protein
LVAVGLSVQLVERIDHVGGVSFVEVFALGNADPLVQLAQIIVIKGLSFGYAASFDIACNVWLSE